MSTEFDRAFIDQLPEEQREQALALLQQLGETYEQNPLQRFHACPTHCGQPDCRPHPKQHEFLVAKTPIQAAFSGNRFGKSAALTVKALAQILPDHLLPPRLRQYRIGEAGAFGRIVCPDLAAHLYGVLLPEFRKWCPPEAFESGSFDKAWNKPHRILRFADGSFVQFMTFEMDLDKFGGSSLDFVGYDEPPPQDIRNECRMRLVDRDGFEMFAMTPLMGIGWVYREIWKKREHRNVTVVKGSIHDNPHISATAVERTLADLSKEERQSREHGDFAHFGGMVYPGGFRAVLRDPPSPQDLRGQDIVVGIDPGMVNAAFVWVAFDRDNRAFVFHEDILQDQTPRDYAGHIRSVNRDWGIVDPDYVIDPSARSRSLVNAESVETVLMQEEIFAQHGQNDVEAGIQQVRVRMQQQGLFVSKDCFGLIDEAEEYRREQRPDGEFKPVKENDHRLDALRYAVMSRMWTPTRDKERARNRMGYRPDYAEPYRPGTPDRGELVL